MNMDKIITILSRVPGVSAIGLGGSQSRKEADANSDYDIGVYYNSKDLDLISLGDSIKSLDDQHREGLLYPPGEWGPWINGGSWITVDGISVDILLKDINRVEAVLKDCLSGKVTIDYQCGHPFGFVNTIYAAETHYCKPLWQDESSALDKLKALLYSKGEYSPQMREAVIKRFLWEAWFSLYCGRKAVSKGDINYDVGSVFRTVCAWIEVLYALNNSYLMNEKGAFSRVDNLNCKPNDMEVRVKTVYQLFMDNCAEKAYQILDDLHNEIAGLSNEIDPIITKIR